MRRAAIVLVLVLLVLMLLVVPVGMGAGMAGMPCPDCTLAGAPLMCFVLALGLATILAVTTSWRRVAGFLPAPPGDGEPRVLERPPR
jgi:hypothetical protein